MFRPAITPVVVCVLTLGLPFGLLLIALDEGWRVALHFFPLAIATGAVTAFAMALLFHFLFTTRVTSDGIHGFSFWGFRRFTAWKDVSMASPFRLLNLRWVRLFSSVDDKTTYVALFPSDSNLFKAELHRLAPPECPIFEHIQ
jgi:hypothetical protein